MEEKSDYRPIGPDFWSKGLRDFMETATYLAQLNLEEVKKSEKLEAQKEIHPRIEYSTSIIIISFLIEQGPFSKSFQIHFENNTAAREFLEKEVLKKEDYSWYDLDELRKRDHRNPIPTEILNSGLIEEYLDSNIGDAFESASEIATELGEKLIRRRYLLASIIRAMKQTTDQIINADEMATLFLHEIKKVEPERLSWWQEWFNVFLSEDELVETKPTEEKKTKVEEKPGKLAEFEKIPSNILQSDMWTTDDKLGMILVDSLRCALEPFCCNT